MIRLVQRMQIFAEHRPLIGWYIALVVTLDFLLHLFESHAL